MTVKKDWIILPIIVFGLLVILFCASERQTSHDWQKKVNSCAEDDFIGYANYPAESPDDLICVTSGQ